MFKVKKHNALKNGESIINQNIPFFKCHICKPCHLPWEVKTLKHGHGYAIENQHEGYHHIFAKNSICHGFRWDNEITNTFKKTKGWLWEVRAKKMVLCCYTIVHKKWKKNIYTETGSTHHEPMKLIWTHHTTFNAWSRPAISPAMCLNPIPGHQGPWHGSLGLTAMVAAMTFKNNSCKVQLVNNLSPLEYHKQFSCAKQVILMWWTLVGTTYILLTCFK